MNGGPGCSGVGGGLFSEQGPFRPNAQNGLYNNQWTWASVANVIFIEQPAGVGFSYSDNPADYTVGDARAAEDVYQFLQGFLEAFPQYRSNELYISGESYGGHYIPTISAAVVRHNIAGDDPRGPLNFAGFLVGNAWTDAAYDNTGALTIWYNRGMISNDTFNGVLATCNMSDVGPLAADAAKRVNRDLNAVAGVPHFNGHDLRAHPILGFRSNKPALDAVSGAHVLPTYKGQDCNYWTSLATTQMGNTDIYDVFVDVCTSGNGGKGVAASAKSVNAATAAITDSSGLSGCAVDYDPCVDSQTAAYLNRPDVQAQIYVNASTIPTGSWTGCSSVVNYSYADLLSSMFPVYTYLLNNAPKARYLVFSGDVDGIVPFTGTRLWLSAFAQEYGLTEMSSQPFRAYNTPAGQVAGWTYSLQAANGAVIEFASVRNAGHLVPATQGSRGLQMFNTFLSGQPF